MEFKGSEGLWKHTRGLVSNGRRMVAQVNNHSVNNETAEANGRLLAAAPLLFRELVEAYLLEGKIYQQKIISEILGVDSASYQDIEALYETLKNQ